MYSMKKIFSILSAGLVALAAISCVQEKLTVFDPTQATAPVLASYEVTDDGISATYNPGSFGQNFNTNMPVNHSLVLVSVNGAATNKIVSATFKEGTVSASVANISKALMALGCAEESYASFDMVIRASMQEVSKDNGRNGHVDSDGKISVSDFFVKVPEVKGNPWKDYTESSPWSLIGSIASTGNSWNKDEPGYMVVDGNKHVVMKITLGPDDQFKFRKDGGWDTNFGAPGDTEPFVMTVGEAIEATGNGKNLAVPAEGQYDILLDEAAGTITIYEAYQTYPGFDQISNWTVIGSIASFDMSWNKDVQMTTDGEWHVAEGVVLSKDDQFKFRMDLAWDTNIGAAGDVEPFVVALDEEYIGAGGGKNLAVAADGTYDLLCNPSTNAFKIVESLGGKSPLVGDEPEPEPEPTYKGWGIIGDFNSWGADAPMTEKDGVWTGFFTNIAKEDGSVGGFKFRKDADWAENLGAEGDVEPAMVTLGEPVAAVANGKNLGVAAGFYQAILDLSNEAAPTITIKEGNVYSLIGGVNGSSWDKDIELTEKDGVWTSPVVTIKGEFKIRHNFSWADENTYGLASADDPTKVGEAMTLSQPGANMKLEEGDYKVQFTPETKEVIISTVAYPEQLYMIGDEFGGWDWGSDGVVEMTPVIHKPDWGAEAEAQFWTIRYFTADKGFKFNSKKAWGGDFWGLTVNDGFVEKGGNCTVTEDGFYLVHVDLKNEKVHVEPARVYGIGACFGGWDAAMEGALFQADGKTLKATAQADGELRMYAESAISTSDWWTREFIILDGVIDYRGDDEGQGDQERVKVQKGQVISLNFNAGTGSVDGEGEETPLPETMYIIGDGVGGWDWATNAVDMVPVNGKAGQFWAIRYIEPGKGFKFCAQKAWSGDFYSLGEEDSGFTVSDNNCFVAEKGVYMIYVDTENKKICVEPAKVYGIGDCFGGWDAKMEGALFTATEDGKLVGTTKAAGQIRLYAESTAATSDWWTREFVFFEGKIAYRGNGGDQERVTVDAGKKVTLDFNAGTAVVE